MEKNCKKNPASNKNQPNIANHGASVFTTAVGLAPGIASGQAVPMPRELRGPMTNIALFPTQRAVLIVLCRHQEKICRGGLKR